MMSWHGTAEQQGYTCVCVSVRESDITACVCVARLRAGDKRLDAKMLASKKEEEEGGQTDRESELEGGTTEKIKSSLDFTFKVTERQANRGAESNRELCNHCNYKDGVMPGC